MGRKRKSNRRKDQRGNGGRLPGGIAAPVGRVKPEPRQPERKSSSADVAPKSPQEVRKAKKTPAKVERGERPLMERLPAESSPVQVLALIGMMLSAPVALSLLVKFIALPYIFPNW